VNFDELMTVAKRDGTLSAPASWSQGRTVFGGLSAALLCDAMSANIDEGRRLRYLKTAFLKPLTADKPFEILAEQDSSGRTLTTCSGQIVQDGAVRVAAQANFVTPLESTLEITPFVAPQLKAPGSEGALHMRGPQLPVFTQHFDFHAVTEGLPFQGHEVPELGGWMRFEDPPSAFHKPHLVCLIDTWPPAAVPYMTRMAPLSTISCAW